MVQVNRQSPNPAHATRPAENSSIVRFNVAEKKPASRTRTTFRFAHPPPTARSKRRLKIRPRLLLQLHLLSQQSRSFPVLDVLASTIFASRLASRFPKLFKGKDGLGPNDLIVMSSGSYEEQRPVDDVGSNSDDENWEDREVVATICQMRKQDGGDVGKAEIRTNMGTTWEATPLQNGSYEFTTTNADGTPMMVRWVLRSRQRHRASSMSESGSSQSEEKRFTFSIINPGTRRHPVIASMTKMGLEILNQYPSEVPTQSPTTSTPSSPSRHVSSYFEPLDTELQGQKLVDTDEHLQSLIVLTGLWVVFREGWSRTFSYDDAMSQYSPHLPSNRHSPPSRTNTLPTVRSSSPMASPTLRRSESSRFLSKGPLLRKATGTIQPRAKGRTDALRIRKANGRSASGSAKAEEQQQVEENRVSEQSRYSKIPSLRRKRSQPSVHESKPTAASAKDHPAVTPAPSSLNSQGLNLPKERTGRSCGTKEKTVSTATTLVGLGESDDGGTHDLTTEEDTVPTAIVKDEKPVRTKASRSPLLRKQGAKGKTPSSDKQSKRWRGLGKLAKVIPCR